MRQEPVEQQAAAGGGARVEPEGEVVDDQSAYAAQLLQPAINGVTAAVTPEILELVGEAPERMRQPNSSSDSY